LQAGKFISCNFYQLHGWPTVVNVNWYSC